MEQYKQLTPIFSEESYQPARLSLLELSLLQNFRRLSRPDQLMVFKLMDGLAKLTDLKG